MVDYLEIGRIGDIADGTMRAVPVAGHEILLARSGDRYFAADNRCPHLGGRLSDGRLEGTVVTCPRHGSRFDLSNGAVVRWLKGDGILFKIGSALKQPLSLTTYPVSIDDDRITAEIPTAAGKG